MATGDHSMDLSDFARLASIGEPFPHPDGSPIIITPKLATALNDLIETADEVAKGEVSRSALRIALAQLKDLHDYDKVRLGGTARGGS